MIQTHKRLQPAVLCMSLLLKDKFAIEHTMKTIAMSFAQTIIFVLLKLLCVSVSIDYTQHSTICFVVSYIILTFRALDYKSDNF